MKTYDIRVDFPVYMKINAASAENARALAEKHAHEWVGEVSPEIAHCAEIDFEEDYKNTDTKGEFAP